jgi:hypothetical protein
VHVALDGLALGSDASKFDREFAERFRAAHRAAYGYDIPGRVVEIVTLRLKMRQNQQAEAGRFHRRKHRGQLRNRASASLFRPDDRLDRDAGPQSRPLADRR